MYSKSILLILTPAPENLSQPLTVSLSSRWYSEAELLGSLCCFPFNVMTCTLLQIRFCLIKLQNHHCPCHSCNRVTGALLSGWTYLSGAASTCPKKASLCRLQRSSIRGGCRCDSNCRVVPLSLTILSFQIDTFHRFHLYTECLQNRHDQRQFILLADCNA